MRQNELFIGGEWATASTDRRIEVISPHTELPVARVAAAGPDDVDTAVEARGRHSTPGPGRGYHPPNALTPYAGSPRPTVIGALRWPQLITSEIGAPISFAQRAQVALPWTMMNAFCDLAEAYPWREARPGLYGSDIASVVSRSVSSPPSCRGTCRSS